MTLQRGIGLVVLVLSMSVGAVASCHSEPAHPTTEDINSANICIEKGGIPKWYHPYDSERAPEFEQCMNLPLPY